MQSVSVLLLVCLFHFGLGQNDIDWNNVKHLDYLHPLLRSKIINPRFKNLVGRIINGDEVVPHQYPHQAAVFSQLSGGVAFCGGSLISKRYILTAAHCAYQVSNFTVILGAHNITANESSTQTYYTNQSVVHPSWAISQFLLRNDIALLQLERDVVLNEFVQPIRLPSFSQNETTFAGLNATIVGWGKISDASNGVSPVLKHTSNKVETHDSCKAQYEGHAPISKKSHICFSTENGRGACNGDSGGPMLITDTDNIVTQIGIASFVSGYGCEADYPTVYTRISSYLDFIEEYSDVEIN